MNKISLLTTCLFFIVMPLYGAETMTLSTLQNSVNTLISGEVVTEAYRRIGIDVIIKEYPPKRALLYANEGRTDGEMFRIQGIERQFPNLIPIPIAVNKVEGMVHTKRANFEVTGWESLRPYRIGVRRGIKYSEQGTKGMKTRVVNSDRELFDLLENDIVDLVVISRINALTLRGEGAGDGIRTVEPPIESFPLYHYLHRKNQHLAPRLTEALKAMEKEGFIQRVRARFIAEMEGRSRGDTQ